MFPYNVNVSSKYGAPMGRESTKPENLVGPVVVRRVPMVDVDYDKGGAYWGCGREPLWCAWDKEGNVTYFRAPNLTEAMKILGRK